MVCYILLDNLFYFSTRQNGRKHAVPASIYRFKGATSKIWASRLYLWYGIQYMYGIKHTRPCSFRKISHNCVVGYSLKYPKVDYFCLIKLLHSSHNTVISIFQLLIRNISGLLTIILWRIPLRQISSWYHLQTVLNLNRNSIISFSFSTIIWKVQFVLLPRNWKVHSPFWPKDSAGAGNLLTIQKCKINVSSGLCEGAAIRVPLNELLPVKR